MKQIFLSAGAAVRNLAVILLSCPPGLYGQTTYFEQDFSDPGVPFQSATPHTGQVDILYARPNTPSSFSIHPGYIEFLRNGPGDEVTETGGSVHMLRKTPFAPTPRSLYFQFTVDVPYSTLQARPAAYFYIGKALQYQPAPKILQPDEIVFSKVAIYLNPDNSYHFRDTKLQQTSPPLRGSARITWVLNNEEGGFSYLAPDGNNYTLEAGRYDFWINATRWISGAGRISDVDLVNFSFAYYNGAASIRLTDFLVRDVAGILPLQLLYFQAGRTGNTALLEWKTPAAAATLRFEIERSTDQVTYETLGYRDAVDTGGPYLFTDEAPRPANYYRLKLTGRSGQITYSPVRKVLFENAPPGLEVAPNPVEAETIRLKAGYILPEYLMLYTTDGRPIPFRHRFFPDNTLHLYPSRYLPAGIYLLQSLQGDFRKTVKVLFPGP